MKRCICIPLLLLIILAGCDTVDALEEEQQPIVLDCAPGTAAKSDCLPPAYCEDGNHRYAPYNDPDQKCHGGDTYVDESGTEYDCDSSGCFAAKYVEPEEELYLNGLVLGKSGVGR